MAKIDYESEYNNRARVPEHPQIFAQWERDAAAYRAGLAKGGANPRHLAMTYGNTTRQTIDLFLAESGPDAPLAVFIHGGWWRSLEPPSFSHMAAGLNAHGIGVAVPGYDLCPQVGIADIVGEIRAALLLLWRTYGKRMLVYGHSAGGHLAAAMMATDWPALAPGTPADLVPAGYGISGVYDLLPLTQVSMNADFRLDAAGARAVSPLYWPAPRGFAFDAVAGALESSEFLRQSRALADAWGKAGVATRYEEIAGTNHFTVLGPLADPRSAMVARLVALAERLRG
jgi:arylformamidase